jgi:heme exporter protein C
VSLAALAVLALAVTPPDRVQGDAQRLMYLHVPAAWIAYVAFGVTSLTSALYLWRRTRNPRWDRLAAASAELGVLFTAITIALGSLWGRPVWGVWWAWDARLITTLVLLFLYVGYLALRKVPASREVRARRTAIAALVAFVDVPVVHFSVVWWRTLHQQPTVLNPELNPQIEGVMATTLLVGVLAFTALYVALMTSRYQLASVEDDAQTEALSAAVARRRGAAGIPTLTEVGA